MKPKNKSSKSAYAKDEDDELLKISPNEIRPNPENPRTAFRPGELAELQESIRRYGVQVPIAVFKSKNGYILIDGERRWRCASKLNLRTIPALVQKEPTPLNNLLLMFNIHALREQWDLLTIALKLPKIASLLQKESGTKPTESDLAIHTGLRRGVIRKCRLLSELPQKYKDTILEELAKPKSKQTVGEEFFIEMEKALGTVKRNFPDVVQNLDSARDALLKKYRNNVIESNIEFRKVVKIARAEKVKADPKKAEKALRRLISDPKYSITQAWEETVSDAYNERDILTRLEFLIDRLNNVGPDELDDDMRKLLEELVARANVILEIEE